MVESLDGFCNFAVAGSKYGESQFRTAFRFGGEIMMEGTPRNDILVKNDVAEAKRVKNELGIASNKKLLLYAPTLRNENVHKKTSQESRVDILRTLDALNKKTGDEWICLMRAHPHISNLIGVSYGDRIKNVTNYEDMAELLLISDILITDYSSCAGDFALLERPIILFQSDIEKYLEEERALYFEMSESPYYVASSQDELECMINNLDFDEAKENCKDILKFYGTYESGHASEAVAKRIAEWVNGVQ